MHCVAPSFLHQFYISTSFDIVGGAITHIQTVVLVLGRKITLWGTFFSLLFL